MRYRRSSTATLGVLVLAVLPAMALPAMAAPAQAAPAPQAVSWVAALNGPVNRDDHARAVAVDARGDVVAAGDIVVSGFGSDFAVAKLRGSSGVELWRTTLPGTNRNALSAAEAVALDAEGDVLVVGTIVSRRSFGDFAVAKLDGGTGQVLWQAILDGGVLSGDRGFDVAVDSQGNAIAAGYVSNSTTGVPNFGVLKFDGATGALQWRRELVGGGGIRQQANSVTVDAQDDVVAAGVIASASENFYVVKLDGVSGDLQWEVELDGSENSLDEAYAVAVDSQGDVVAAGSIQQASTSYDFAVVKLDGTTGAQRWRKLINGRTGNGDLALDVAVDRNGDVAASGLIYNRNEFHSDFAVFKFDGDSGSELWRRQISGSAQSVAWAVAVTPQGNVVAAGERSRPRTYSELTIVELAAASGAILGGAQVNGDDDWFDQALDVAIDPAGNAVAAGNLVNRGTGSDFAVVQLRAQRP